MFLRFQGMVGIMKIVVTEVAVCTHQCQQEKS